MTVFRLHGADRPFGSEILARLLLEGYRAEQTDSETINVLVVNAPVTLGGERFDAVTDHDFHTAMETLLFEIVETAQAVLPRMGRGGRIVHVAARGHLGAWGGVHWMAANAALIAMTRSMALELADDGIRVNALAPDFAGERWESAETRAELAAGVAFLANGETSQLTGETLLIDGGRSLRMSEARQR